MSSEALGPEDASGAPGEAAAEPAPERPGHQRWHGRLRLLLLGVLLLGGLAIVFALDLHHYLGLQALREHRSMLVGWVEHRPWLAPVAFTGLYALAVVFVPPSGTVMTVVGGFLFGAVLGTAIVVVGATLGATLVFLAARFLAGEGLRRRVASAVRRMQAGFRDNALSYMLVLRLMPVFPFWLVNLAPAFLPVPLRIFVLGTLLGIIPGTAVFAVFGAGLGDVLDRNGPISLHGVLTPQIIGGLVGLAVLSILPVFYRQWKARG